MILKYLYIQFICVKCFSTCLSNFLMKTLFVPSQSVLQFVQIFFFFVTCTIFTAVAALCRQEQRWTCSKHWPGCSTVARKQRLSQTGPLEEPWPSRICCCERRRNERVWKLQTQKRSVGVFNLQMQPPPQFVAVEPQRGIPTFTFRCFPCLS